MSYPTFFQHSCSRCGRFSQVRVEMLGKRMRCWRCGVIFVAGDASQQPRTTKKRSVAATFPEVCSAR